jgi:hypothetical protein
VAVAMMWLYIISIPLSHTGSVRVFMMGIFVPLSLLFVYGRGLTKHVAFIIILVSCAILAGVRWYFRPRSSFDWAAQVSGVHTPAGTRELKFYDNTEWYYVSVAQIPRESANEFAKQYGFAVTPKNYDYKYHTIDTLVGNLPSPYGVLPPSTQTLYLSGEKPHNRWEYVLDPDRGLLWFYVLYPDFKGEDP